MTWSARQYLTFEDERTRPVRDLLSAIPTRDVRRAVDIGCGPGNSTEALAARFPDAEVSGIDNSEDMVEAARKRLPHVRFDVATVETWNDPHLFDVVLANAVFQWVPNHEALLPRLVRALAPAGSLAVQMPDNHDEPAHRLMREVASRGPWAGKLKNATAARTAIHGASWYYELLRPYCTRVDVWRTVYHHPLKEGASGVVEWFKGTGLRPFLAPLDGAELAEYLKEYLAAVAKAYPAQPDGTVLLPFPRLFFVATK